MNRGAGTGTRRSRRPVAAVAVIALLVLSNVLVNRVLPAWIYVPWNLAIAIALVGIAWWARSGPVAIGLGIRHWHRPIGVGLLLAGGTAAIYLIAMLLPATRDAFLDSRAGDASVTVMLYHVLLRIPLGTVVLEEIAFRGVLPALFGAAPALRWRWKPVLAASFLFGLWHILPSIGLAATNTGVGGMLGGSQLLASTLAVVFTMGAGICMCAVTRLGKGVKTTMLLHWATNSLGFLAAWIVLN